MPGSGRSEQRALLVYDGNCGFCSASAAWIAARWKPPSAAVAIPWQRLGATGLESLGLTVDDVEQSAWWVADGRRAAGHLAVARSLITAGGAWGWVGRALLVPPLRWLAAVGYRLVARYRHRLPGGTPACKT
jgi:predicted DCC family thiol-disulfide oxidoreductase YuxK